MKKQDTNKKFHAVVRIATEVSLEVPGATSLEDALEKAKALKVRDFISFHGDDFDSDIRLTQVWEECKEIKL